jgi:hypothetical protein
MARIGYARVSTTDQDLEGQLARLKAEGCQVIRAEKVSGVSRAGRTELATILEFLRPGDELVVTRLDRLGRDTRDVLNLVHECEQKGAFVTVLDPHVSTRGEMGKIVLTVLGMVAQMEVTGVRTPPLRRIPAAVTGDDAATVISQNGIDESEGPDRVHQLLELTLRMRPRIVCCRLQSFHRHLLDPDRALCVYFPHGHLLMNPNMRIQIGEPMRGCKRRLFSAAPDRRNLFQPIAELKDRIDQLHADQRRSAGAGERFHDLVQLLRSPADVGTARFTLGTLGM